MVPSGCPSTPSPHWVQHLKVPCEHACGNASPHDQALVQPSFYNFVAPFHHCLQQGMHEKMFLRFNLQPLKIILLSELVTVNFRICWKNLINFLREGMDSRIPGWRKPGREEVGGWKQENSVKVHTSCAEPLPHPRPNSLPRTLVTRLTLSR